MSTTSVPAVHNHHHVYILGAGFSRTAGLPLIADFMPRMRLALEWLAEQQGRDEEIRAIERVLAFRLQASAASYRTHLDAENVEELFSLASATGDATLERSMGLAIAATLDYAATVRLGPRLGVHIEFDTKVHSPPPAWRAVPYVPGQVQCNLDFYEACAAFMSGAVFRGARPQRTTILTLNYDLLVESALGRIGIPWTYDLPPEQTVTPAAAGTHEGASRGRHPGR